MKTKLFFAFATVILAILCSVALFELMIMRDFEDYVRSVRDDQIYWVVTSVEGGYREGGWDERVLVESIHWAMMMGLDVRVIDMEGKEVISFSSHLIMHSLSPSMHQRMEELFHLHKEGTSAFASYPIRTAGRQVGSLLARPFPKRELAEKEALFAKRVEYFFYSFLLIAGAGAILLGLLFSHYLSKPVTVLKRAAERIAAGDFTARASFKSGDEVGMLAETFDRMAGSLEREEQLRKHLMANIAHELRTPLTVMKTQVEAMTDGIVTDTRKGLDNIGTGIDQIVTLIKGIEDVTAAEAAFFTAGEKTEIDLHELLSGLAAEFDPLFRKKDLALRLSDNGALVVKADIEKIERIARNILSNALKFTDQGDVTIRYGASGQDYFIEICDTGSGIPQDEICRVFDRFYRSGQTGTEGLGLGLAIVKELVEAMSGTVTVTSTVGQGSCFKVVLPK